MLLRQPFRLITSSQLYRLLNSHELHDTEELGLSSGRERMCFRSSGKWVCTLRSTRLELAQPWEDIHGSKHWEAAKCKK